MRLQLFIFCCLSLVLQNTFAQEEDLLKSLQEMPDTLALDEGREVLIKSIGDKNRPQAELLKRFLIEKEDSITLALYREEKILLHFWLFDLQPLTKIIHHPDSFGGEIKHWPSYDTLYPALVNEVGKNRISIKKEINYSTALSLEEKDFLLLALGYFIGDEFESQERINEAADQFLANYPESEYRYVVENSFRQIYYPSKSKFSASLHIGNNTLEGDMSQLFRDNFAIGFTLAYYYHNWLFHLSTTWGFTAPRRDILLADRLWERNQSSSMTQFETSIGYVFLEHRRFSLIPFAGIGTTSFAPMSNTVEGEEYFRGVSFKAKFTNYAGLGVRYNIQKQQKRSKYFEFEDQTYSYLKIQYRFANPFMDHGYDGMGGHTHLISLSYGWFIQPITQNKAK